MDEPTEMRLGRGLGWSKGTSYRPIRRGPEERVNLGEHLSVHCPVMGISCTWSIFPTVFVSWQQRCGLLLSALQQLDIAAQYAEHGV